MTHIKAESWIRELAKAVKNEHITVYQAHAEVFAEMEDGDHDTQTETFFYNFTQSDTSSYA